MAERTTKTTNGTDFEDYENWFLECERVALLCYETNGGGGVGNSGTKHPWDGGNPYKRRKPRGPVNIPRIPDNNSREGIWRESGRRVNDISQGWYKTLFMESSLS